MLETTSEATKKLNSTNLKENVLFFRASKNAGYTNEATKKLG